MQRLIFDDYRIAYLRVSIDPQSPCFVSTAKVEYFILAFEIGYLFFLSSGG